DPLRPGRTRRTSALSAVPVGERQARAEAVAVDLAVHGSGCLRRGAAVQAAPEPTRAVGDLGGGGPARLPLPRAESAAPEGGQAGPQRRARTHRGPGR